MKRLRPRWLSGLMTAGLLFAACSDDSRPTVIRSDDIRPARQPAVIPAFDSESVTLTLVADGIEQPVEIAWYGTPSIAYVATQVGLVLPLIDGEVGAPVLDLSADLATETVEQGLLGLAFHPTEPYGYVNYTRRDGDTVIAEYPVLADGSFAVDSARTVLLVDQPTPSHNGGNLTFGPDGYLYIGMGDGGSNNDPDRRALDLSDPLGKILRIDPRQQAGEPYGIPADNPFVGTPDTRPEIWSFGLRNPWRFSFDAVTGDLWVGDVGQNEWEEVTVALADGVAGGGSGVNFGWSEWEGSHPFNADQQAPDALMPYFEYIHGDEGCAVTGGVVYRGTAITSMVGWYVFGDWCSGKVWAIPGNAVPGATVDAAQVQVIGRPGTVTSVRAGPDGEVYVVGLTTGAVHRVDPA